MPLLESLMPSALAQCLTRRTKGENLLSMFARWLRTVELMTALVLPIVTSQCMPADIGSVRRLRSCRRNGIQMCNVEVGFENACIAAGKQT